LVVEPPQGRTRQVENMVQAFQLNLTALSFIALFVAAFMIHNAVSLASLRRRAEIGVMRAMGVTRGQVRTLFLAEGAALGLIGGALGLALGTVLARGMLGAISRTLSDLYLVSQTRDLRPDPLVYAVGMGLALAASIAAALLPAREAAATPPAVTMRQGVWQEPGRLRIGRWTLAGFATLALAAATAWWTLNARIAVGGFVCAFLVLAGFTLLAPGFTLLVEVAVGPMIRRAFGIAGALGARFLREAVSRTSVVVAALMVSVAMMVALTLMVGSFRQTVDLWVRQSIRGDLYVEPAGHRMNAAATDLPRALVDSMRAIPGVVAVDTYRGARIVHGDRTAFAAGVDFDVQSRFGRLQFERGEAGDILARAGARGGVIVTESFARHHRVAAGDTIALAIPRGLERLRVEGVFYDYSTDAGGILMDASLYAKLWEGDRVESLALYLAPGMRWEEARREVIARAGAGRVLYVMPNQSLRAQVLRVFDQTFRITAALQAIAVLVAVLGLVTTLTALILQRGREIGVLRAAGTLRSQVRTMVLVESGLLGLIGTLLGCVCGLVLAMLLVHVINRQFFGWTIRLVLDPWVFVQALVLLVGTAVVAGLIPARLAARRQAAEAVRMD
ncbi:MAG: FtsX-like permease family protein, partial [Candidatus Eisenbacteria bacterium]